jgi:maltose O-acetyltransferase
MHFIKRKIALIVVNNILCGARPSFFPLKRNILNWGGFQVGKESNVVGPIRSTGILIIGSNVWIGANLTCHGNGTVEIEDNCAIGPDVTFLTGGHEIGDRKRRAGRGITTNIKVRKGSWIGSRTTVLGTIEGNIEIGEACVVAAGAVVTKNIENNKLIGGVPAKVIRNLE